MVDGPAAWGNYPSGITSIALFGTSVYGTSTNVNCTIDGNYLPNGALYVGGIEVNGYSGIITQGVNNRFVISDCPGLNGCAYNSVYKAVFNFGSGGEFRGSTTVNVAGSLNYQDNYTMAVGVEMFITGGLFYAPRKMLMENHLTLTPGCFVGAGFDGSGGVVSFYPRPGSISFPTYFINAGSSSFHDLQIYTGKTCDLNGGNVTVANNLITAGSGGYLKISNGQLHIKRDIIINSTDYSTYSLGVAHNPGGTAMLYLDGSVQQNIIKNVTGATETSGPLGNLTIDNNNGVIISERVNIAGSLTFVNGIISPQTSGSPNDVLVFDNAAVVYGASDAGYCEAPVRKHMYSLPAVSFEFPVGKSGEFHPAIISSPTGGSGGYGSTNPNNYTQFTVEYFDAATPDPLSVSPTTFAVHNCQYWSIERNNKPTSNAKISLTWNAGTCDPTYFSTPSDLRVAQYDGTLWQNRGVNGAVGTYTYGSKIQEAIGAPVSQFITGASTYFAFCHATAPPLVISMSGTQPTCAPGTDGTVTATVSGAIGTITYSWSTSPVQTTPTATGLPLGGYTVTVTTTGGQSGTGVFYLAAPLYSDVTLPSVAPVYCETSLPILLNLGTPLGGTYSGSPYIYFSSGNYYFDPQLSGPGTFTYTYTDGFGCGYTRSGNIIINPGPDRPLGWEWATGPTTATVSRGADVAHDAPWDMVYTIGHFSGTVDFGGVTLTSAGGEDVFVLCHIATTGALNWARSYGGTGDDYGTGITFTGSKIAITGYFTGTTNFEGLTAVSNGLNDGFFARLDHIGNVQYLHAIGGIDDDKVNAITNDGTNYYISGFNFFDSSYPTISFGSGVSLTDYLTQSFVAKYVVASGTCMWAVNGSADWQRATAIDLNADGNIIVGGNMTYLPNGFLERYNSGGTLLNFNYFEAYTTGYTGIEGILGGISHDLAGNIFITGYYSDISGGTSTATFNTLPVAPGTYTPILSGSGAVLNGGVNEVYWAKYEPDLKLAAATNIGANGSFFSGSDIIVDASGDQYVTAGFLGTISNLCYSIPSYGYDDIFVMKLDNSGNFVWAQKPDGGYYEANPSITLDNSGGVYLTGSIAGGVVNFGAIPVNSGATNTFTAKLGPTGSSVYRTSEDVANDQLVEGGGLAVFPNPNNGQFTINTNSSEPKDVMVYDMTGRLVFSMTQTTESTIAVDISSEAKGLYIVKVISGDEVQSARVSNQ